MNTLQEAIAHVETLQHQNSETEVSSTFKSLVSEEEPATGDLLHEMIAFAFGEHNEQDELGWNTYFGPGFMWNNVETITVSPDITRVDGEMIDYWKKRAAVTNNPLLKARYAGLVWDMEKKITNTRPDVSYAIMAAESLITLSEDNRYKYDVDVENKLKRALALATGISKPELIDRAKKAIMAYEDKIAVDDKPGLWGFSFDYLVDNRKALLTEDEEATIIASLEARLKRLANAEHPDPHAAETAATRLADYYRKRNKAEDTRRVMLLLGQAYEADSDPSVLNRSGRLEHLHKLYVHYQLHEDAAALLVKLRTISAGAKNEFQTISHKMDFPREDVERLINWLVDGDEKAVTMKIVGNFSPDKSENEKSMMELARKHPFSFMIGEAIMDERGRTIAQIGTIINDPDGRLIRQICQHMAFQAMFLRLGIEAYCAKFEITSKKFIEQHLTASPAFIYGRWQIIKRALDAYFAGDWMAFLHFMMPQLEDAFRTLVEISGGQIMKLGRGGGLHLKTFDEILRDESIVRIFGEDYALYIRILFTEQRGWNLRNDLCHGLMSEESMGVTQADRLFHVLMTLSLLTSSSPESTPGDSPSPENEQ